MKILYVLVSSESDFYYEQALISIMSAKHQMPNCSISLLTERETDNRLKSTRNLINEYLAEKVVIDLNPSFSPMQKSRWLKTSMRGLVKGDFLYVDVDTVFAGPIDESLLTDEIMGVPDGNYPLAEHPLKWSILEKLKIMGYDDRLEYHINSGVLFFKDTPKAKIFAEKWHKLWMETCKKGIFIDQIALHQTISIIKDTFQILPNTWNAQFGRNINTLARGIILHYYSSWTQDTSYTPAYKFLQNNWLTYFRNNPKSKISLEFIQNPKEAFDTSTLIMGRGYDQWHNSQLIQLLGTIHKSKDPADKRLYLFLEKIDNFITKYYYKTIKKLYALHIFFKKKR